MSFAAPTRSFSGKRRKRCCVHERWRYILLPAYIATYHYDDETYQIAINGQSGTIAGPRPVDWRKVWLIVGTLASSSLFALVVGNMLMNEIGPILFNGGIILCGFSALVALVLFSKGWNSKQITKTRIRWEKRVGALNRPYNQITTAALQNSNKLKPFLESYDLTKKQAYSPEAIASSLFRLPTRSPHDALADVVPIIEQTATQECQQAAEADHIRDFTWQPTYPSRQWTLLLRPLYSSYYLDDDQQRQPVLLHGQSGLIIGKRRASMQRAKQLSLLIVKLGIAIALLGLLAFALLTSTPAAEVAMIGLFIALLIALSALLPLLIASGFNRMN